MKKAILFLVLMSMGKVYGQQTAKQQKIKEVLELTGSAKIGIQFVSNLIETFKSQYPTVPEEFWTKLLNKMDASELEDKIIPIYDKHFTEEEINDLMLFYKSKIGKKMIDKMPIIFQESQEIGKEWGRTITHDIIKELEATLPQSEETTSPPPPMR